MAELYPLLFEPNLHETVWGGRRLRPFKGLVPSNVPIGESWEVSAVTGSTSVVANGSWAGHSLDEVIASDPASFLGEAVAKRYDGKLPLLVKFIDAAQDLSIQVHPDDEMAMREHGKMGKSEMWYIIDAQPGSYLYAGFREEVSPEEYKQKVEDGTIVDVLARHEVKAGDVFYLPAGRVHAICGGILLAEVQQSSDVTYRIFDYNRPGMDGRPRELHTELAAKAIDFQVADEYRTQYGTETDRANRVIDSPFFNVRVTEMTGAFHRNLLKYDSFIICMCIEGDCRIRIRQNGQETQLNEGHSALIPAAIADYDVIPIGVKTRVLDAFIDNKNRSLGRAITRFLHITSR